MTRILVYTPTYDDRLQDATMESIQAMQFDGELDHVVSDDNPYPGRDMRNCVHQFVKGRQLAIDGKYDGLLLIEHDMIVPEHAAQRLWDTDAPVVYGSYELRHRMYAVNLFQYVGSQNIGMSLSLYPKELRRARKQGWLRVSGAGFGCLLIKRDVFTRIAFRDVGNAPDLPFATDCVRAGITCIGRTDVECGHIDIDNDVTLWPFEGRSYGMLARVIGLQDVTVLDREQSKRIRKDKYASLDPEVAMDLQRAGYVRITNEVDDVIDEMESGYNDAVIGTRETATAPEQETTNKLNTLTKPELQEIAKRVGLEGYSTLRKAELIAAIKHAEGA